MRKFKKVGNDFGRSRNKKIPDAQYIGDCRLEEGEVWRLFGAYSHSIVEGGFEEMS